MSAKVLTQPATQGGLFLASKTGLILDSAPGDETSGTRVERGLSKEQRGIAPEASGYLAMTRGPLPRWCGSYGGVKRPFMSGRKQRGAAENLDFFALNH